MDPVRFDSLLNAAALNFYSLVYIGAYANTLCIFVDITLTVSYAVRKWM